MAYVTTTAFKAYRKITGTKDDGLIADLITRSQRQIETYTHRTFAATTTACRYYDAVRDVSDDRRTLYLDEDLCEIESVVNGDGTTVATTHYTTNPRNETPYHSLRMTWLSDSDWTWSDAPEDAIKVTGKWAYSTAAPADIQHATIRLATYLYSQKDASVFDVTLIPGEGVMQVPQGLPRDVRIILDPYRKLR